MFFRLKMSTYVFVCFAVLCSVGFAAEERANLTLQRANVQAGSTGYVVNANARNTTLGLLFDSSSPLQLDLLKMNNTHASGGPGTHLQALADLSAGTAGGAAVQASNAMSLTYDSGTDTYTLTNTPACASSIYLHWWDPAMGSDTYTTSLGTTFRSYGVGDSWWDMTCSGSTCTFGGVGGQDFVSAICTPTIDVDDSGAEWESNAVRYP